MKSCCSTARWPNVSVFAPHFGAKLVFIKEPSGFWWLSWTPHQDLSRKPGSQSWRQVLYGHCGWKEWSSHAGFVQGGSTVLGITSWLDQTVTQKAVSHIASWKILQVWKTIEKTAEIRDILMNLQALLKRLVQKTPDPFGGANGEDSSDILEFNTWKWHEITMIWFRWYPAKS